MGRRLDGRRRRLPLPPLSPVRPTALPLPPRAGGGEKDAPAHVGSAGKRLCAARDVLGVLRAGKIFPTKLFSLKTIYKFGLFTDTQFSLLDGYLIVTFSTHYCI